MKRIITFAARLIPYAFVLLFIYAAVSKLMDFENFRVQLAQSPMLSAYAGVVSYGVIALELLISLLLLIPQTRKAALYASFGLMAAFTVYIYLILNYSDFVPCSCGGILEKLGWKEHLFFNIIMVGLACTALFYAETKRAALTTTAYLLTGAAISSAVMVALFLSSEYIIKKENNFTRRYLKYPIILKKTVTLDNQYYYFAGGDDETIYLGNIQNPLNLLAIESNLKKRNLHRIKLSNYNYPFKNIKTKVLGSDLYVYDGTVPTIFRGKIESPNVNFVNIEKNFFSQLAVTNTTNFILRIQSHISKELELARLDTNNPKTLNINAGILDKQTDGVFDSDGNLITDIMTSKIVYIYSYRNQFIVTNPLISKVQKFNTIDTTAIARVKATKLSNGKHQMSAPAKRVNNKAIAFHNLLFNQSLLKGRHEPMRLWNQSDVIDLYNLNNGQYIGSLYLYEEERMRMSDFFINNNFLYTIRENKIYQYQLTNNIKKHFKTGDTENLIQE